MVRLMAVGLAAGGMGLGSAAGEDSGADMLKALRSRSADTQWDATAEAIRSKNVDPMPEISKELDPEADETSRAIARRPGLREVTTAQSGLPPVPETEYDPTPMAVPNGTEEEAETPPNGRRIAQTPNELRDMQSIMPYADYDPNPNADDPCLNQCPRPDGAPCKEYGEGETVPRCPEEVPLGDGPFVGLAIPPSVFAWKASNVTHNPLYFEDVALERYGHSYGPLAQPVVSLGRFSAQLVTLPYHMTLDPPRKEVYPLGYYRPGECAPHLMYQPPLNAKAAAVTAGFYTGFGLILP